MGRPRYTITENLGGGVKRRRTTNTGGMIGYEAGGCVTEFLKLPFRILWWVFLKGPWLAIKYAVIGAAKLTKLAWRENHFLGIFVGIVMVALFIVAFFLIGLGIEWISEHDEEWLNSLE